MTSDAAEPVVHFSVADGIATITLDSQHNRNALSRQLVGELTRALDNAQQERVRAVVLRHEGPAFCAGADLKERSNDDAAIGSSPFVGVLQALMNMDCPTIAAVNGAVRAGGIGLMASCDLVVVQTNVSFALTEVRIGVAPAIIAVPILRRVPASRIAAAMLTGEQFDANEARDIGLITHVADDVAATTATLCEGIRAGAPTAVAATKRLMRDVVELDTATAFDQMQTLSEQLFRGPDAAEGMAAFREKRRPVWPGPPPTDEN